MRKFFIIILFLISFLFFNEYVFSQNNELNISIPGINCGIPDDPLRNKCCSEFDAKFIPPNLGPLTALLDNFKFFFQYQIDSFFEPIANFYYKLFNKKKDILVCQSGSIPSTSDFNDLNCRCIRSNIISSSENLKALELFCQKQSNPTEALKCLNCANKGGVWTGIGCVYTDLRSFIQETVFKLGIGLAGGFALLCIIYAAFQMQSSQGNPEKLKKAQEMITSCIMGLMLIIFSVFILRLIGVNILQIPGFK